MLPEISVLLAELEIYFRLVWWLFVPIVTMLLLFLCWLYLTMQATRRQEQMSFSFSQLAIEGMEIERRRISRELHDIVLPLVRDSTVSDQIRSICMELMPPDFSRLSLKDALAEICDKFERRSGIECVYSIDNDLDFTGVSAENQLHLYRMVQESFTNIEKHSRAKKAALVTRRHRQGSEDILICVSDDGIGLKSEPEGLGMRGMRQRAAILGAQLDFISEPGNGLMVRIEIQDIR
jgi:signal transduction histidine kinase